MLGFWRLMDEEQQPYRDIEVFMCAVEVNQNGCTDIPVRVADVMPT